MSQAVLRIGVIGGGQLARMMIAPAKKLGISLKVLAESQDSPAAEAATLVGDYTQLSVVRDFAKTVDVISFDHEHVPLDVLTALEAEGVNIQPPSRALRFAQNKLQMRKKLGELGLPMPVWAEIKDAKSLDDFLAANGGVAILKTPIGGYDGKGVMVVRSSSDASAWLKNLDSFGGSLLAEEKVNFVRELSQLSSRSPSGDFSAWPLVETIQENGVCSLVLSPAPEASVEVMNLTKSIARSIAEGLGVTGMLAVELFETTDGRILINELAMRPHNSGHFSIEGSATSQFEQHLRAVADLPLGDTTALSNHSVMLNLLGVDSENDFSRNHQAATELQPEISIHTYGKSARIGRKMGHITCNADNLESALTAAKAAAAVLLQG